MYRDSTQLFKDNTSQETFTYTGRRSFEAAGPNPIWGTENSDNLFGTARDDIMNSRNGSDTLHGGRGNDAIFAFGEGFDTLYGDEGSDSLHGSDDGNLLHGGSGDDYVYGGENYDKLNGDSGNDFLSGKGGVDKLSGGFGSDTLVGGSGVDELVGGWDADTFRFSQLDGSVDVVSDFNSIAEWGYTIQQGDRFELSLSAFGALSGSAGKTLHENEFALGTAASTSNQHILYDQRTGVLLYDADGNGSTRPIAFAKVTGNVDLTASDFLINL